MGSEMCIRDSIEAVAGDDNDGETPSEIDMRQAIENCRLALDYFQVDGNANTSAANDDSSDHAEAA